MPIITQLASKRYGQFTLFSGESFNGTGTFATVRFRAIANSWSYRTGISVQFVNNTTTASVTAQHVTAKNALGSGGSALFTVNGSPDRSYPDCSLVSPAPFDPYLRLFSQPLQLNIQDPYNQVERLDIWAYYGDGSRHVLGSDTNGADGWGITWNTLGVPDGVINFYPNWGLPGELIEGCGGTSRMLDRTPPSYVSSSFSPSSPSNTPSVQVNVGASDNLSGVKRIEMYVNSASDGSASGDWLFQGAAETGNNAVINWNTSSFAPGTYQIVFAIEDNAGNWMRWDNAGLPTITYTLTGTSFPTIIQSLDPLPPYCVLRNSANLYERLLVLTGVNFSTTNQNMQFQKIATAELSLQFHQEINWESSTRITVDIARIKNLLWTDSKVSLTTHITTWSNGNYTPVSAWSPQFFLANDVAACGAARPLFQLYLPAIFSQPSSGSRPLGIAPKPIATVTPLPKRIFQSPTSR